MGALTRLVRRTRTMRTTLIIVAITLALAACANEIHADESAADLYQQQSELFDSLLQKPAKKQTKTSRAEKVKEIDAKVALLNKHTKKHAKKMQKKDVETSLVQEFSPQKEKRAAKVKEVDAKVLKLNKRFSKKSAKAQPKKRAKKVQKKKEEAVETTLLQEFSSQKEKRAAKVKEVDAKVAQLNKRFSKKSAKVQHKKRAKKVQKKKEAVETTLLQEFSSQKEKRAAKVK